MYIWLNHCSIICNCIPVEITQIVQAQRGNGKSGVNACSWEMVRETDRNSFQNKVLRKPVIHKGTNSTLDVRNKRSCKWQKIFVFLLISTEIKSGRLGQKTVK